MKDKKIEIDIKKIKTKEQLEQFADNLIEGKIHTRSSRGFNKRILDGCLVHLANRESKIHPTAPKVICDMLRVLYNNCDDEGAQKMVLIITSMVMGMQKKLVEYKKKEDKLKLNK